MKVTVNFNRGLALIGFEPPSALWEESTTVFLRCICKEFDMKYIFYTMFRYLFVASGPGLTIFTVKKSKKNLYSNVPNTRECKKL